MIKVGDKAANFSLQADDGKTYGLGDFAGKHLLLYFYPKDNTPGCTMEARDFAAHAEAFEQRNAVIVGVSKDSISCHQGFKKRFALPFLLLSDPDGKTCEGYGVWAEKSMFGKKYMGIERVTFLIDPKGVVSHCWPKVKVKGHAEEVLATLAGYS
jgi:thioredoxin-dependent peroxiredoxin